MAPLAVITVFITRPICVNYAGPGRSRRQLGIIGRPGRTVAAQCCFGRARSRSSHVDAGSTAIAVHCSARSSSIWSQLRGRGGRPAYAAAPARCPAAGGDADDCYVSRRSLRSAGRHAPRMALASFIRAFGDGYVSRCRAGDLTVSRRLISAPDLTRPEGRPGFLSAIADISGVIVAGG